MARKIEQFNIYLQELSKKAEKRIMEAQQKACQKICKDIQRGAPVRTGAYRDSIKVSNTFRLSERIFTRIYSNMTLGGDNPKWQNVPLATIIENGTKPHFITPRNPEGVLRWEDDDGTVHYAKWVWHPGTVANPHWSRALMRNKDYYRRMIRKAYGKRLWTL